MTTTYYIKFHKPDLIIILNSQNEQLSIIATREQFFCDRDKIPVALMEGKSGTSVFYLKIFQKTYYFPCPYSFDFIKANEFNNLTIS